MNRDTLVWVADHSSAKVEQRPIHLVVLNREPFYFDETEARLDLAAHLRKKAAECEYEAAGYRTQADRVLAGNPLTDDSHRENDASGEPDHGGE